MGARDIMPFNSPHGGHCRVYRMKVTTVSGLFCGEPVRIAAAGTVTRASNNAAATNGFFGIAMAPYAASTTKNPETGVAWADLDCIPVIVPDATSTFIGRYTVDDSTLGTPSYATIGDAVGIGMATIGGVANRFCFSDNASVKLARVVDVLDARRRSVLQGGGTGVYVVCSFAVGQTQSTTAIAAPA